MTDQKQDAQPVQVDGQPESPGAEQYVDLAAFISDEYGTSRTDARLQISLGRVEIDGELWEGDKFRLPRSAMLDKMIDVIGETKRYRFLYRDRLNFRDER